MRRKNQEGAIVIEATIALTSFMFLIVTILSIVNICLVQSKMGTLVHGIAKDISNYTYIYTMTGLNEKEQELSSRADYARNSLKDVKESSTTVFKAIESLGKVAMDDEFWNSMLDLLVEGGIQEAKASVIDSICKSSVEKRLQTSQISANAYLVRMGIEGGIEGLDFTDSSFCAKGGDDINIVVSYKVHVLELLGIDFDFEFQQCAATKTWCASTGSSGKDDGSGKTKSEMIENEEEPENEEPDEKEKKTLDDYVRDATHNTNSQQVMLGEKTGDKETDYIDLAKKFAMTYFELDDESRKELEESREDWTVRQKFLEEQEFKGKSFYLSSDPYYATGEYAREIEWLYGQGYTFKYDPGVSLWKAVRE